MNSGKVNAFNLFWQDLKKKNANASSYSRELVRKKYNELTIQERDYFTSKAKLANEKLQSNKSQVYTTQKDTLGIPLKEVTEIESRMKAWLREVDSLIARNTKDPNIFNKPFYLAHVNGSEYMNIFDNEMMYACVELTLIKMSFSSGIIDQLTLYPEVIDIPIGHREKLFEQIEDDVGYRPDTFKASHQRNEIFNQLSDFFGKKIEPIFVATKFNQERVANALYTIYKTTNRECPWIKSFRDWGDSTKIYKFESLIYYTVKHHAKEIGLDLPDILSQWSRMCLDLGPETCERHEQYGQYHQCTKNVLLKYAYSSIVMIHSICFPDNDIAPLVSSQFYNNLEWIMPVEKKTEVPIIDKTEFHSNWNGYYIEQASIDEIIAKSQSIDLNQNEENQRPFNSVGRGRGNVLAPRKNKALFGGDKPVKKIKLPNVIC